MAKGASSRLGYLMDLLGIPATELAEFLKVERTNVSKWKTGSRPFSRTSNYYEQTVSYLMMKNNLLAGGVLQDFFRSVFGDEESERDDFLPLSIRRFLSGTLPENTLQPTKLEPTQALYQASFSVYVGAEGRQNAIVRILETAEALPVLCTVCILEADQFEWALHSMGLFQNLILRMTRLMDLGHKIELLHLQIHDHPAGEEILRRLILLSFHKNMRLFTMSSKYRERLSTSLYMIENKIAAYGMGCHQYSREAGTLLFTDTFTVSQMYAMYCNFRTITNAMRNVEKSGDLEYIQRFAFTNLQSREPIYFTSIMLSLATMSDGLYEEIMLQSNLSKTDLQRCDKYRRLARASISTPDIRSSLFLSTHTLREAIIYDWVIQYSLSALSNGIVRITQEQYRRHLRETADFIEQTPNLYVALDSSIRDDGPMAFGWFKKNLWAMIGNQNLDGSEHKLIMMENPTQINLFTDLLDSRYYATPVQNRTPAYVAEVLREISRGDPLHAISL